MAYDSLEYLSILNSLYTEKDEQKLISKFLKFLNQQYTENKFMYTAFPAGYNVLPLQTDYNDLGYLAYTGSIDPDQQKLFDHLLPLVARSLEYVREIEQQITSRSKNYDEQEEKYQSLFSQISEGVYRLDLDEPINTSLPVDEQIDLLYKHVYLAECNLAFVKMYGAKNESDIIGYRLVDMHQPEVFPQNRELLRQFIENNYMIDQKESQEADKRGKVHYFLNNSIGILKNGFLLRIWGTQSDISTLKKSQIAHQQSEDRYRSLFNATFEATVIHDHGTILAVNNAFEKLFRVKKQDIIGSNGKCFLADESDVNLINVFSNHIDKNYQMMMKRSDGKKFLAEINGKYINYDQKKVRLATIRDITEQKKAANKLQENEFRYRLLFESINDCAFVHGFNKNNEPAKYVEVNQSACTTLGYTREELLKLSAMEINHNVKESYMKKILSYLLQEGHVIYEMDVKTKNGQVLRMENSSHIFMYKRKRYALSIARDITDRKQSERLMKQKNEELIRANQELDNFVYRVSHDLRAPITSSLGLAELLQRETSLDNVKTFSKLQAQSLTKLDNFINEILHYSRNTRIKINPVEISALKLIESVVSPFIIMEEYKQVKFDYIIEGNSRFYTDKQRIEIVLSNLVSNAFKYRNHYHPEQFIRVSFYIKPKLVTIKVTDNGIGIKPEYKQRVFDMFFRATENNTGSGLGLYIVNESLKKLKGRINLKTEYGKGSEFTVDIPNLRPKEISSQDGQSQNF